jgi:hypothetical protein
MILFPSIMFTKWEMKDNLIAENEETFLFIYSVKV